jgi:hypothetical protein
MFSLRPREKVVDADHLVAFGEQMLNQVRSEEPGAPGDRNAAPASAIFAAESAVHDPSDDIALHDGTCFPPRPDYPLTIAVKRNTAG